MGSIVKAHCGCGYEKEMFLGGGMLNFTTHCNFPLYCAQCKILFEGNLFKKKITCPKCGTNDVVPYDSDKLCSRKGERVFDWNATAEIGRVLELTEGDYICPKCGRFAMSFADVGRWD